MRVDGVQYNLLCEQSVHNIWRKRCFHLLKGEFINEMYAYVYACVYIKNIVVKKLC